MALITSYAILYATKTWREEEFDAAKVIELFDAASSRTGPVLYEEIKRTADVTPHMYLYLLKDNPHSHLLHRAMVKPSPLGIINSTD